jgi:hypothetical protein
VAFLTLNGVDVPVATGGAERTRVYVGGHGARGLAGGYLRTQRADKREWTFTTTPLPVSEVPAWEGLIRGAGHHWPFDSNAISDRGLAPELGVHTVYSTGSMTNAGNYGMASGYSGTTARLEWYVGQTPAWSIITVAYQAGWWRWVKRSDGALFRTGVVESARTLDTLGYDATTGRLWQRAWIEGGSAWAATQAVALGGMTLGNVSGQDRAFKCVTAGTTGGTLPTWNATLLSTVTDGTVTWQNVADSGGAGHVGDLTLVPYLVPDAWVPGIYAFHLSRPWTALPRLAATGTFAPAEVTVRGEVVEAESVRWQQSGVWQSGERLTFTLREV